MSNPWQMEEEMDESTESAHMGESGDVEVEPMQRIEPIRQFPFDPTSAARHDYLGGEKNI